MLPLLSRLWLPGTAVLAAYVVLQAADAGAAQAASPWWSQVALAGHRVTAVAAAGRTIVVRADGRTLRSSDGTSFSAVPGNPPLQPPTTVRSGQDSWGIADGGRVVHTSRAGPLRPDPGSPDLGRSARLIAAPAALPGVVVAVADDGAVWRRAPRGGWRLSLVLLPAGFPRGTPRVTAVAAFAQPLSSTVYLATDGYSVLDSPDAGDDWIRAGPGLPDSVLSLAADSQTRAVYAGTADGLWAHRLQGLPGPPAYRDTALTARWAGTGLITLVVALLAVALLLVAVGPARAVR